MNQDQLVCPYSIGYVVFYYSLVDIPGATLLNQHAKATLLKQHIKR